MDGEDRGEITWGDFFRKLKDRAWFVMILILLGGVIASTLTLGFEKAKYTAMTTLVVNKEAATLFYEDKYTQSDIEMYQKIINTYIEIAKSNTVIDSVAQQLNRYSAEDIREMVTQAAISDTLMIEITVEGEHPEDVAVMANVYCEILQATCSAIMPVGDLKVVDRAKTPLEAEPSKVIFNTLFGMLLGSIAAVGSILGYIYYESTRLMSKEDIEEGLQIEVWVVNY